MTEERETYPVEIAGVKRQLPLFEVAPGLRIAVLNILGDTELVEASGKALAERLGVNVHTDLRPTLIAGAANVAIRSAMTRWSAGQGREDLRELTSKAFRLLEFDFGLDVILDGIERSI